MKNFIIVVALVVAANCETTQINAGNGVDLGEWGVKELCPDGTYAAEMEFKYEDTGYRDDTRGNGMKLYCLDKSGYMVNYVTSSQGRQGRWQGVRRCSEGTFIVGYAMRVEGLVGNFSDNLGVTDVRVKCEDGIVLDGLVTQPEEESRERESVIISKDGAQRKAFRTLEHKLTEKEIEIFRKRKGLHFGKASRAELDGTWGPIASCPKGTKVCGLQTEVKSGHLSEDDVGLSNLILFCCDY